ncbi:NLI interacting factor-like phosphatase-domain-containing protein [Irpex rosettiformis]|uniref:NLI interacting factor-like phosphatase-domain-containing protein n=1 Tax=Irpex rosettiformis TaxID=378272 RepID=A0ACB8U4P1_9APHY|nr:NLI interacting factor-like phosphatase-domain-containing protein [Irpex rosettiformis]
MNSLTYLSRQFDVLAAARTPPSTPSIEHGQLFAEGDRVAASPLKRVQTWSQKSFVPTPSPTNSSSASASPWSLRRSYSSPADVNPAEPSTSTIPSTPTRPAPIPSGSRPPVESIFYRIFFVRILLTLWHYALGLWRSMAIRFTSRVSRSTVAGEEKPPIQVHPEIPTPPPLPLPMFNLPSLSRNNTDPGVIFIDSKSPSLVPGPVPSATSVDIGEQPRTSTPPSSVTRKTPLHFPKTLVLDLDETLIHSTSRPMDCGASGGILNSLGVGRRNKGVGHTVEVVLGGRSTLYHVYKRPFVDYFLRKVSTWYTLVIFTASMQEYADPVIDWLDAGRGILGRRLFRESCTQLPNGNYTKDLSIIEQDLSRVCLVDNSPVCYSMNESNGIPIEGWINDPHDEALLDLLPVLDSLRFTSDVRRVLGIRGFGFIL